jgi:hypothetical protein
VFLILLRFLTNKASHIDGFAILYKSVNKDGFVITNFITLVASGFWQIIFSSIVASCEKLVRPPNRVIFGIYIYNFSSSIWILDNKDLDLILVTFFFF